jgi:hypothetical protein
MSGIKDWASPPVAIPPPSTHSKRSLRSFSFLEKGDSRDISVEFLED